MNEEETEFNEPGDEEKSPEGNGGTTAGAVSGAHPDSTDKEETLAPEEDVFSKAVFTEERRIAEAFTAYLKGFEPSQEFSVPAELADHLVVYLHLKFTVVGVNEASGIARIRAELE